MTELVDHGTPAAPASAWCAARSERVRAQPPGERDDLHRVAARAQPDDDEVIVEVAAGALLEGPSTTKVTGTAARAIPSAFIRSRSVDGRVPRSSAAPPSSGPLAARAPRCRLELRRIHVLPEEIGRRARTRVAVGEREIEPEGRSARG